MLSHPQTRKPKPKRPGWAGRSVGLGCPSNPGCPHRAGPAGGASPGWSHQAQRFWNGSNQDAKRISGPAPRSSGSEEGAAPAEAAADTETANTQPAPAAQPAEARPREPTEAAGLRGGARAGGAGPEREGRGRVQRAGPPRLGSAAPLGPGKGGTKAAETRGDPGLDGGGEKSR